MFDWPTDTEMFRKESDATPSVAAHGRFTTIGIEIAHFELFGWVVLQNHQPIGPNAHATVAKESYPLTGRIKLASTPINYNEVVTSTLIFVKMEFHL